MLNQVRIPLCIILLSIGFRSAAAADGSLRDRSTARTVTPEEAAMLGPQAANYRYDRRMIEAAKIAKARAQKHSTSCCWRYVKTALLAAGAVDTYPKTAFAKQAARELSQDFGFRKLWSRDPYRAPLGSVLVYGGADAGHVEIRTADGYVSDFASPTPYDKRPLIGIYVKPRT